MLLILIYLIHICSFYCLYARARSLACFVYLNELKTISYRLVAIATVSLPLFSHLLRSILFRSVPFCSVC